MAEYKGRAMAAISRVIEKWKQSAAVLHMVNIDVRP